MLICQRYERDAALKRVLIVDDSVFARKLIHNIIDSSADLEVAGVAKDGQEAINMIKELKPDVITLDVEMPVMNGLETLVRIMDECPVPVVMLSSLTSQGAETSLMAFSIGAVDVLAKPVSNGLPNIHLISDALIAKVTAAANVDIAMIKRRMCRGRKNPSSTAVPVSKLKTPIIVIASSTGGPMALRYLVPRLPIASGVACIIVQHLPIGFTAEMARHLDSLSPFPVREAVANDRMIPGTALIAPSGVHCAFSSAGRIILTDDPPLWGVRPSADITMATAAAVFKSSVIGVVLTGMGCDGAHGIHIIKSNGGQTFAEHE